VDDSLAWFRDHHAENMERMFAAVGELYAERWGEFFHFAVFEEGDDPEDRDAAFERTHRRYAEALRVGQAARVLELACGRGGFAAFLAARTEAKSSASTSRARSSPAPCGGTGARTSASAATT
jgi:cyclopropane fatty-acyl-phospholipid synthase-like methyltransferase